jgi:hypothetical protein
MSDITLINDSEQSSLVTNGLAKNGELYLKKAGSTNEGAIVVYDSGSWRTFANEAGAAYLNTYSLSFDGANDHVTASPVTSSAQQGTVSAWIKTSTAATKEVLCQTNTTSDTTYLFLSIDSGGYPRLGWQSGSSRLFKRGSTQVNDGNWHHVVYISDGSAWKIYVDGADEGTLTTVISGGASDGSWYGDLPSINALRIGCQERNLGTTSFFNGNIDEVAIWDSALSSSDITSIYNSGVPNDISSLSPAGWWRMGDNDSGTGTTITDQGSGGNDGTLTNGPTFSTDIPS